MTTPTRAAGLDALRAFVPHAGADYRRDRNHDTGPARTNVSGLSPYIRHRLVTEQEVVDAVLDRHSLHTAEKFVQEVFWRTYWKGWLEQRPEVWRRYRGEVRDLLAGDLPAHYEDVVAGRSGIEAMDAWVRELVETGYLHNHTRMWFASIWVFTLELPWQLGADFFSRHLLDGDAASNTLSWRWVAGLQTRGKTYLATTENIARYTDGRFAPTGLATEARALDEEPFPAAVPVPSDDVDGRVGERVGLLLHEEDLEPESLLAASRSSGATVLNSVEPSAVLGWAGAANLDTVVVPYAPVGPVRERLDLLRTRLGAEGVALVTVRRRWDGRAWPYASRGFFPFRERIPGLVRVR
ncbi:FAD-binding domain-containing protein [Curtobacterium citreum]|uniref:FAD-binding domain-containing protein n=1 Tax=Curtobacterium citreum TaxID=2036 RepID=UPI002ED16A21